MHEFSIATQIVESVLEFAQAQGASSVVKVRMVVGQLMCVEPDQLKFCFESITHHSLLENAELEIETAKAFVNCPHCHYEGEPAYWEGALAGVSTPTLACPKCGKAAEPTKGHECSIKSVQFLRGDLEPSL